MERPKIITIEGPTASGKTSLGIFLAKGLGRLPAGRQGEIISADSRQVYRGLDIGTEKITLPEMDGVPHHLIDIADPTTPYTAANFQQDAKEIVRYIVRNGHVPIVVGGTGFYVHVLINDIDLPEVPPNEPLRQELEILDAGELFQRLQKLDPDRAASIDPHNPRRLIRAIEIATALGSVPLASKNSPYDVYRIGLSVPDDVLRERITARLEETLARGLIEETREIAKTLSPERIDELGLEYRLCAGHLRGELSHEELVTQLKAKLWQYAKRQKTWFKAQKDIHWYDPSDRDAIEKDVQAFLAK